ncbi:unnamed protein product [Rhizoctonia solani]|uniref:Uncharacterized protein n=1 Tax=Rhizoctonia solani TaxID=456999 RepID=A0A8H3G5F2_9AGAM|nr:unnamed protein product [Rhizoctonia solani]
MINTEASVIVWAASGPSERAYESRRVKGGSLANAVCDEIIKSPGGTIERKALWDRVMSDIDYENKNQIKGALEASQRARVLASSQDGKEIMNTPLFWNKFSS